MHEALLTEEEAKVALETGNMYVIPSPKEIYFKFDSGKFGERKSVSHRNYHSENGTFLGKEEIKKTLKKYSIIP